MNPLLPTTHRLLLHDSRDLSAIPDDSIHCVVTSPPYPLIAMWDTLFSSWSPAIKTAFKKEDGRLAFELIHAELDRVWSEMYRLTRPGGFLCVNIGDATRTVGGRFRLFSNHSRITAQCVALGFDALPLVIWNKTTNAPNKFMGSGMLPAGAYVTLEHEYVLVFRKGDKREFISAEEKKLRRESALFWEERNAWFSDTWDLAGLRQELSDKSLRKRSAAFPFELAYRLINMYSVQGDTVLDPFLGTGTSMLAALASRRSSIGVESDPSFEKMVADRIIGSRAALNRYIQERIKRHGDFVKERLKRKKEIKYKNSRHGFRVVTGQETDVRLGYVGKVDLMEKGVWNATYTNI
jgi:modification methylase